MEKLLVAYQPLQELWSQNAADVEMRKRPDSVDEIYSEEPPRHHPAPSCWDRIPERNTRRGERGGGLVAHTCDLRVCLAEVGRAHELQATRLYSKTPPHNEKKARFILAHFSDALVTCLWAWVTQHIVAGSAWQRKLLTCGGQETKERKKWGSRCPLEGHIPEAWFPLDRPHLP